MSKNRNKTSCSSSKAKAAPEASSAKVESIGIAVKAPKIAENENVVVEVIDLDDDDPLVQLSIKVFGNDMLLEMILTKIVVQPGGKLSRSDICSLRGVNKSWLQAVSDILRKRRDPLYQLTLNKDNSRNDMAYCKERGKLLEQFVRSVAGENALEDVIPTFSLKLEAEFFRRENHKDLSDCLVKCGSGLVSCDLTFPLNSSMVLLFHSFSLPKLQRLTAQFSDYRLMSTTGAAAIDEAPMMMNNNHTVYPLQTILNETEELQELSLRQVHLYGPHPHLIPLGFEYLNLPETITKLLLDSPMRNSDLTLLIKNDLPNLVQLRLCSSIVAYDTDIIYEILNKYRSHLRILNLRGLATQYLGQAGVVASRPSTTLVNFPLMERLETLTINSQVWELDGEEIIRWERQLPVLSELRLLQHSEPTLRKWANTHAMSSSVKRLFVSLVGRHPAGHGAYLTENPAPLTLEIMQGIHLTMPFLTCLEITVCGEQTCALKYLFLEMRGLEKLAISVKGSADAIIPIDCHWDALLIGIPIDVARSLRKTPSFWNHFELKDSNFPSIRKLKELKSLALVENFYRLNTTHNSEPTEPSIISDMVFHFAFFKMPALKYLLLSGRFKASTAMSEKWQSDKGNPIHSIRCSQRN